MNNTVKAPEEKKEMTFETIDQLAEYLGADLGSLVIKVLWDLLKSGQTTDQEIIKMAANM